MADVVGKTIFSDGKGKLFFGYYKTDDGVQFVDYKTWKKLSFKDVSKGDTNKERVIKAILKNQKQFNKKVEFNMWANQKKRTFEETMDWFIQNGWINNINKGGIKESVDVLSVNEIQYKDAVAKFNDELIKHPMIKKAAQHYKKTPAEIVKVLQQRLSTKGNRGGDTKEVSIDFKDTNSGITIKHKKSFNESINEASRRATDFYGDSNHGKSIHSLLKGKWDSKKVENYLEKLGGGSDVKYARLIDFISKDSGLNTRKYKNIGEQLPDLIKQLEVLYKDFLTESVNEAVKPSQVSSTISKVKKELMRKWKQKGGYENFGQKELSQMKDKFDYNPYGSTDERQIAKMLDGFNNWAMNYDGNMREGKKRFKQQDGIGSSKYTISYHDGKKKNKDGSDFFDIKIFKNKPELEAFKKDLVSKGFVKESVNEAKFGYTDSTASYINKHNNEYKIAEKMNKGNERKFYDDLQAMEDKVGHSKTMKFISNALRGYGVDMFKDPKIKNPADAQEALFLLSK